MATTQNTYPGDGSTTEFTFDFLYLEETDIKVSLDGVDTTEYVLANATTISLNTAPALNVQVRIYRETDSDTLKSTFFPGSAIRAQDLNDNFLQSIYTVQEVVDRYIDNTGAVFNNDVDMNGNKIINLANGTADGDAVNKAQLDDSQTYNDAQLASTVTSVNNALTSAQAAQTAAETAQTNAETAETNAETAQTAAEAAQTAAETAETNAATSAAAAASFAGSTVFFGFRRDANHHLLLDYSITTETDTYATSDYEYKNGSQWYIGSNDILHQTGPNLGEPRFAFNADGHLILSDT